MGYHGVPQMPLFVYKAIADEVSRIEDTDALVNRYCAVGASVLYQRNTVGEHILEENNADATAFAWLSSALDVTVSVT
jgi:Secretory lipase